MWALISLMQVVIDHCRQQVVCSWRLREIAGRKVQIHLLEWQDLALALPATPPLTPKVGPGEGWRIVKVALAPSSANP